MAKTAKEAYDEMMSSEDKQYATTDKFGTQRHGLQAHDSEEGMMRQLRPIFGEQGQRPAYLDAQTMQAGRPRNADEAFAQWDQGGRFKGGQYFDPMDLGNRGIEEGFFKDDAAIKASMAARFAGNDKMMSSPLYAQKPKPIQDAYDPSGGRGFVPPNTSSNYPDVRGQNQAPGTGNPGPLSPPGGTGFAELNPQMNNQLSPPGGSGFYELNNPGMPDRPTGPIPMPKGGLPSNTGVVGPPMPTPDQLNGTGGIKPSGTYQPPTPGLSPGNTLTGVQPTEQRTRRMPPNGGMQNNSLSGALGGPPSSMGGLSTPRRQPGMPNPRPTRNFGSKLGANRGVI